MGWKYIGDGSTLLGVPARDLEGHEDEACVSAFEAREGVKLEDTGLYVRETAKPPRTRQPEPSVGTEAGAEEA